MAPLFVKRNYMWISVLLVGLVMVGAGVFQLVSGLYGDSIESQGGTPASGVQDEQQKVKIVENSEESNSSPKSEDKKDESGPQARKNQFFVEYRLERDRTRSQQVDLLREIVNNQNSGEETRREAQRRLLAISQAIETEMKVENLIRAEEFKDAVVFIQEKSATVIVQAPVLTAPDKNKIIAITSRITGISAENVVVISKI